MPSDSLVPDALSVPSERAAHVDGLGTEQQLAGARRGVLRSGPAAPHVAEEPSGRPGHEERPAWRGSHPTWRREPSLQGAAQGRNVLAEREPTQAARSMPPEAEG